MEMFFRGAGASYLVEKKEKVPDEKADLDGILVSYLWSSLGEEYHYLVEGKSSALEAWKLVHSHFNASTMPRRIKARHDFYHVEHDPSQSIDVYIHSVNKARQALVALNCKVDDTETLDVLLMNLHSSYEGIRTSILTAKDEPSLESVKSILTGSARSVMAVKSEPTDIALAAQGARRGGGRKDYGHGYGGGRAGADSSKGPSRDDNGYRWCDPSNEGHCHRCGRSGHIAARCIHDMPQHVKDWVMSGPPRPPSSSSANQATSQEEVANSAWVFPATPPGLSYTELPILT